MEFPLAVGLLGLILILGVWFPLVEGGEETPAVDMAWALAIVGVPVVNLLRYERAPWGCLPLALSVLAWGLAFSLGADPLVCALLVIAPNALFLLAELSLGPPLRRAQRDARLAELDAGASAEREVELLKHRAPEVQARAAAALAARPWGEVHAALEPALASRLPPRGLLGALGACAERHAAVAPWVAERLAGAIGELHQPLGELLGRHGLEVPEAPADARVGHAVGVLQRDPAAGIALAVGVLADASLTPAQRQVALEALDAAPETTEVVAAVRAALGADAATAELLWVFHDHGQPEDAPAVAALLGSHDYDVANAAVDALAGVLARGELGQHRAPTLAAVQRAHQRLRAEHTPGENRLADGLAGALGELEADLSQAAPSP